MLSGFIKSGDRQGAIDYCERHFKNGTDGDVLFSELMFIVPANWFYLSGELYKATECFGWYSESDSEWSTKKFYEFLDLLFYMPKSNIQNMFSNGQCSDTEMSVYFDLSSRAASAAKSMIERNAESLLYRTYDANFYAMSDYQLGATRIYFALVDLYPQEWPLAYGAMILTITRSLSERKVRIKIAKEKAKRYAADLTLAFNPAICHSAVAASSQRLPI